MKIGFIGAGLIGGGLARLAVQAGHEVFMSNSREPRTLFSLMGALGQKAKVGSPAEAAAFGDLVVVTVPFYAYKAVPVAPLEAKVVIDTMNYFPPRDGNVSEIDSGGTTSSELLARHLPGSKVVRAFNAILSTDLAPHSASAGTPHRRAIPMAGDTASAKQQVAAFVDSIGFDPVDVGALARGKALEYGGKVFCVRLDAEGLRQALTAA
jgi:predicted dinucleotide-binding enzyme